MNIANSVGCIVVFGSLLAIPISCGGGGGGKGSDVHVPLYVEVTEIILRGEFTAIGSPVQVMVDGTPAAITGNSWSCPVVLTDTERVVTITLRVNNTVMSAYQVSITQ
jgi:hypothetical protein